jgi:hypothetical protein
MEKKEPPDFGFETFQLNHLKPSRTITQYLYELTTQPKQMQPQFWQMIASTLEIRKQYNHLLH